MTRVRLQSPFEPVRRRFRRSVFLLLAAIFAGPQAHAQTGRVVPVYGQKLAYSRVTGLLYASVPENAPRYANTVTAVNPISGAVAASIAVGGSPWELELSDDERFLWVGVTGPRAVRIDLVAGKIDLQFSTYFPGVQPDAFITDIEVFPGRPGTIAVCHWQQYGGATGVAIFDHGVVRAETSRGGLGVSRIAFGAPDTVWGYNGDSTGFEAYRFQVHSQGIRAVEEPIYGLFDDFFLDPIFFDGLLYSRNGRAVDPMAGRPDGRFYTPWTSRDTALALDAANERIYFAATIDYLLHVMEFDLRSYRPTRTLALQHGDAKVPYSLQSMVRCGPAGLALGGFESDSPWITIIPLSALEPVDRYLKPAPQPLSRSIRRIPLPNNSIVYDSHSDRIYASLSNRAYDIGNSILPLDPAAGVVGDPVWVGSDPSQMAVSDDGRYLYVSLLNNYSVLRLRLPGLEPDVRIPLWTEPNDRWRGSHPVRANDLLALPGQSGSVAVAKAGFPGASDPFGFGVAIYDHSVERPQKMVHLPDNRTQRILGLQPAPDSVSVYGSGAGAFAKLGVDSSGVSLESFRNEVSPSFLSDQIRCEDRFCLTTYGAIIDGETQENIGEFAFNLWDPVFEWPVAALPDLRRGLAYFVHSYREDTFVSAYDVWTLKQVARLKLSGVRGANGGFLLWGRNRDQLAVSTPSEIVLFPLSALHSVPLKNDIPEIRGQRLFIPFFRAGPGTFTGIAVSNPGDEPARIQWTLVASSGETRHHQENHVEAVLEPNQQTARLGTEIFDIPPGNPVEYSWVEVKTELADLGSFFQYGSANGLDGSVALSEPIREFYFTRMFQGPGALRGRPAKTTFAVANPNGFGINLRITAYTKGRRSVDPPMQRVRLFRLPAKGFLYDPVFTGSGLEYSSAYVKVETFEEGAGAVGFALVEVDEGDTLIGLAQQTLNEGDRLYSAQLAFGPGIFTNLSLVNLSSEARSLWLRAVADDGADLASPVTLTLRPGEHLEEDVRDLFDFRHLATGSGSLEVVGDGPGVIGDVIFGDPSALRYAASLPLQTKPFRRAVFSQVANRHDFFTGLAFFNPSSTEAYIRIEVFAEDGTPTGERTMRLGPGRRLSRLLADLIPSTAGRQGGFVKIESNEPIIGQQLFGDYRLDRLSAVPPTILE